MSVVVTETYPATVVGTDDPQQRGRIRVACAALLGDESAALPMWIEPVLDWGWFTVPDVGEIVDIEVATGSTEDEQQGQVSIDNLDAKWRGGRYYGGAESDTSRDVADEFKQNYGKRRGFATPGGLILFFDDTDDSRQISLTWNDGQNPLGFSHMSIDKDGSVIWGTKTGHLLTMNAKTGELSLIDQHGNSYSSNENGLKLIDKFSNILEFKDGVVQLLAQSGLTASAKDIVLDAGLTQLGGSPATEPVLLGNIFLTLFANHIHSTGMGPSGPALVGAGGSPALWSTALSTFVKTK